MRPQLQRGDMFVVRSAGIISRLIIAVEWFNSKDGRAHFGHSGIITGEDGRTLEALWTVRTSSLERYIGQRIFIVRPVQTLNRGKITDDIIQEAISELKEEHMGRFYPWWRIPLHLVPPLAKFISWKKRRLVCSELVARYEQLIGMRELVITGVTPDDLEDRWRLLSTGNVTTRVVYDGKW